MTNTKVNMKTVRFTQLNFLNIFIKEISDLFAFVLLCTLLSITVVS